jgi:hypothetical protein
MTEEDAGGAILIYRVGLHGTLSLQYADATLGYGCSYWYYNGKMLTEEVARTILSGPDVTVKYSGES